MLTTGAGCAILRNIAGWTGPHIGGVTKDPKTPTQLSKLQMAEQYARLMADLLTGCDEPVLASRAAGFAQTVDLVLTEARVSQAVA